MIDPESTVGPLSAGEVPFPLVGLGICVVGSDSAKPSVPLVLWNRRLEEIAGWNAGDLDSAAWIRTLMPDGADRWQRVLRGEHLCEQLTEIVGKDGKRKVASVSTAPSILAGAPVVLIAVRDAADGRTDDRVRRAAAEYRSLTDHLPDAVVRMDLSWRPTYANPQIERFWGRKPSELLGRCLDDLPFAAALRDAWIQALESAVRTGIEQTLEYELAGPRFIDAHFIPEKESDGNPRSVLWVQRDLTLLRTAQGELERSRSMMAQAQRRAHFGCWEWHVPSDETWWSDELYRLFDIPNTGARPHYELMRPRIHPEDVDRIERLLQETLEKNAPFRLDHRIIARDGTTKWVHAEGAVERDAEGKPIRFAGSTQDITHRKEAEASLRRSEANFRGIFENSPAGIVVLTPERSIVDANPAFARFLGCEIESLRGRRWESLHAAADPSAAPEVGSHGERAFSRSDGGTAWGRVSEAALRDPEGNVHALLMMVQDWTALRFAEEMRREMDRKSEESQRLESLGILAGGVAHDFNNLLTTIMGYASLAAQNADPEAQEYLRQVEIAARSAGELCRQMLACAGKNIPMLESVDLNREVRHAVETLRAALPPHATIKIELAELLPRIRADGSQVRQVVQSLATNAFEALRGEAGEVRVTTGMSTLAPAELSECRGADGCVPGAAYAWLEVADTGVGMEPSLAARIFDPFVSTKFTGRGLGLAAVLGIVRSHAGAVRLRSAPGAGSTFRVYFPLSAEGAPARVGARRETVLVADDEESVRRFCRIVLESAGFAAVVAEDGPSALNILRRGGNRIGLAVLDVSMPGFGGADVLQSLQAEGIATPVLLTSGYDAAEAAPKRDERCGFLQKPFARNELLAAVRRALPQHGGTAHRG